MGAYEDDDSRGARPGGIGHLLLMQVPYVPPTAFLPPGGTNGEVSDISGGVCPCCGQSSSSGSNSSNGGQAYTSNGNSSYASDGTVPDGSSKQQNGTATICYDGTNIRTKGDTWQSGTAGGYGSNVPWVVQNRNSNGGYTYPQGTKVLAVNNSNGKSSWGVIGDNGPTNSGRSEMNPAMADNLGVGIRNKNGQYTNSTSGDNVSYYYYPNK